jgi:hypothetical protein
MQIYNLQLNAPSLESAQLGSIDLLSSRKENVMLQTNLFGGKHGPKRVAATGDLKETLSVKNLDLCVMNPPFTRSVGGNLLFGSAPSEERETMQKKLKQILNESKVLANVTAGLGSVFVALGDRLLKKDGRLALVLPRSLLSGVAWEETRRLLSSKYSVEYVVVSHEPYNWNFSENTSLGETLIVAKKRKTLNDDRTTFINLWRRPRNTVESLTCSNLVLGVTPARLDSISGTSELASSQVKYGEVISSTTSVWSRACAFAQTDLNRAAYYLAQGKLQLPGQKTSFSIPLVPLSKIASIGPDRRDIADGFSPSNHFTSYPALWGHEPNTMQTISASKSVLISTDKTTSWQTPQKVSGPLAKSKCPHD